jgi:hypothetical protein
MELEKQFSVALAQCGPEIASLIAYYVVELREAEVELERLDPSFWQTCRAAGIGNISVNEQDVVFFEGSVRKVFVRALTTYTSSTVDRPPGSDALTSSIWRIERTLRGMLRSKATSVSQDQRVTSLIPGNIVERCLRRAQEDAFPWARSSDDLPDIFDWMTLGEILRIIETSDWARWTGFSAGFLRRLGAEVAPIRNRWAHMQLPRLGDRETVRKWERRLLSALTDGDS